MASPAHAPTPDLDAAAAQQSSSQKFSLSHPGQINKRIVATLLETVPIEKVVGKVNLLLDATIQKRGDDKPQPDIRAIEAGSKLWISLAAIDNAGTAGPLGPPVDENGNVEGLEERMMRAPALLEMVRGMVERAEAFHAAKADKAKTVKVS